MLLFAFVSKDGSNPPNQDDVVFHSLGATDELSSLLGLARAVLPPGHPPALGSQLEEVQCRLQDLGSLIATPDPAVRARAWVCRGWLCANPPLPRPPQASSWSSLTTGRRGSSRGGSTPWTPTSRPCALLSCPAATRPAPRCTSRARYGIRTPGWWRNAPRRSRGWAHRP